MSTHSESTRRGSDGDNVVIDVENNKLDSTPQMTKNEASAESKTVKEAESQPSAPSGPPPPPNGGFDAWLRVFAAFLIFFNTWSVRTSYLKGEVSKVLLLT